MSWFIRAGMVGLALLAVGCDYSTARSRNRGPASAAGPLPGQGGRTAESAVVVDEKSAKLPQESAEVQQRREVILANVVKLIQLAGDNPGGRNFAMATENLNELFEYGTTGAEYNSTPDSTAFLSAKIYEITSKDPTSVVKALSSPKFTIRDARHIEDCMLYHDLAVRIAGEGDDLSRVRRIFDWVSRNIQLVPAGSLTFPGLRQAQARPADVLIRGMATEAGAWSERGWLFLSLCRQIGIDAGILTYTPRRASAMATDNGGGIVTWIVAAIVDDKPYLFDQRIGLEVARADGTGVATLEEVLAQPEILERLDLPGESNLGTTAAALAGSPTRVGVLVDSSVGYMSPRMRLLQSQLRGEYRTVLFRDPAEQARHFAKALGTRFGGVQLWRLPLEVEELLFTDASFVAATQASLVFFDTKFPLLKARTKQLHGQLAEATDQYVSFRFAEHPITTDGKETPIPPEQQRALDAYSTYFLAQTQFERGNVDQADYLYRKLLELLPAPGPGRYFYYMMRWGALNNLARIAEGRGHRDEAIAFYDASDSGANGFGTPQHHGNLVRARRLVWQDPTLAPTEPLPAAPTDPEPTQAAEAAPAKPAVPAMIAAPARP